MPIYTSVSKPTTIYTSVANVVTNYKGTPLWSAAYLPWLLTSFPWLKTETGQTVPTYTSIPKPT